LRDLEMLCRRDGYADDKCTNEDGRSHGCSFGVTKLAQRTRGPQAAHVRKCASILGGLSSLPMPRDPGPSPWTMARLGSD